MPTEQDGIIYLGDQRFAYWLGQVTVKAQGDDFSVTLDRQGCGL